MENIGILLAGGSGTRFQSAVPKQYAALCGREVLSYSVSAFQHSHHTHKLIAVAGEPEFSSGRIASAYALECVRGGETRNASVGAALRYIKRRYPGCKRVLIHEAARPFLTAALVDTYWALAQQYDAVITAKEITDSLGCEGQWITDRSQYYLIQAPEAFSFPLLAAHFDPGSPITATVQQIPPGSRIKRYYGFCNNLKITYPQDLEIAECMMRLELESGGTRRPQAKEGQSQLIRIGP